MDSIRSREYVCIGKGSLVYVSGVPPYRDKNTKREGGRGGGVVREGSGKCWSRVSIRILMCGRSM